MVDVVLDQCPFRLTHGLFNSMELLGDVHALTSFLDHGDDAAQVAVRSLEALDDGVVSLVGMSVTMRLVVNVF